MTNGNSTESAITAISVKGFKSLYDESRIEIRPLTILAGANNSGKSSIMQPLLLMKQTLEASYDPPAALKIDGPNIGFSETDQFLSRQPKTEPAAPLTVQIELSDGVVVKVTYFRPEGSGLDIAEMTVHVRFHPETQSDMVLRPGMSTEELTETIKSFPRSDSYKWRVERHRCFLSVPLFVEGNRAGIDHVFPQTTQVGQRIQTLLHVCAARANLERTYPLASSGPSFPGLFVAYVATLIYDWQQTADRRFEELKQAFQTLGLTRALQVRRASEVQVEVLVDRLPTRAKGRKPDLVNISHVGSGVQQVLPVLVALLSARTGQLVYLEEPEIHLHPRAQTALAEVLADAAKRGVRVVVETHSSLLLLGIQSLVAQGTLDPDLVALHWFSRNKKGATVIASAVLDEAGRYGDWPEDFAAAEMDAEQGYLDASDEVLFRQQARGAT